MKKLFSILSILAAASVAYAQTNKFIAVGWNTNNAPIGSIPFVRSATSNGWTAGAPGESYFLSASNNTTPYPHFQPIYGSNIVGGVASAGSSNVFLVVSNLTVTNTWVSANISDSNWTTVASVTADGNPYDIRWDTHMQIKWDGTMDANIRLVTWFTYTDIYGVSTTNFMYDLVPNSDQYLSYHIGSSYTAGGNSRPDIAVNTDYGWTAGSAFFVPKSNTSITITAQRVGSYAGLTTGGATNVANYYFTSIGNGSGSSSSSSSGSASNVYFLDSPSISWSQVGGSNYAQVTTSLTNAWRSDINSASNSITSVMTNLFNTTSNILWAAKVTTNLPLTLLSTNQGSSLSNTVDLIAGDSSVTIVTNANKRSFTLTSTGGSGGVTAEQMPSSVFTEWESASGTLVTLSGSGTEASHLSEATVGFIGDGKTAIYYTGYDAGNTGRIHMAVGSLRAGWTKVGAVLSPTAGTWDSGLIGGATHYRENNTNYLYYFGGTNFGAFEAEPLHIGVAWSTNGTNFTKAAAPILRTNDVVNSITLYTFFVKKIGATYYGFFNAKYASGQTERVNLATATNPLGPWTYYGEIFNATNHALGSTPVTSDFTVVDYPGGGYLAAYWFNPLGTASVGTAYSTNLINWTFTGTLSIPAVGTRLWFDDGLNLSICDQTSVSHYRPKTAKRGSQTFGTVVATTIYGNGTAISNVAAYSSTLLVSSNNFPILGGTFDNDDDYWISIAGATYTPNDTYSLGYNATRDSWFTYGSLELGTALTVTNRTGLTNVAVVSQSGSMINGVRFTNNIVYGNGSGLSNAVDLIAGSNITITTNADKRSYTISASAGAGSGTFDYAQLTNVPVRIGTLATNNAGQALTNLMGGISINSIPVETADGGLTTTAATITGSGGDTITVPFLVGSSALTVGTNSIRNVGSSINGIGLTNGSLTVPGNINMAGTFNVGALNATNFVVTNPWNAANATNIQATNILSTFSIGNIAGGFGGNSFWLGQNAVLIGENFSGAAFDSRLAAATAQGGSSVFIGNPSGMTGSSTWRLSSYPTNTGSYAVIRYAPSGSPGINFSNRFCMDTSLMMGRVDLLQLSVGAVSDAITIATTDSIRWLANTNWSANWIAECTSNSVSSYFTSSIPWAIDAKMMFSIDCTPTAARFYTNGILATTITTNIPVGRAVTPALRTMATANTGAATISSTYFDYVWVLIH